MITVELIGGPLDGEIVQYVETEETILVRQLFVKMDNSFSIREIRIHHYHKTHDFIDGRVVFQHKEITVEKVNQD